MPFLKNTYMDIRRIFLFREDTKCPNISEMLKTQGLLSSLICCTALNMMPNIQQKCFTVKKKLCFLYFIMTQKINSRVTKLHDQQYKNSCFWNFQALS